MTEKKKLFIDYVFITSLWILVGIYWYDVIFQGFIGNINNYFAFGLLVAVTLSKVIAINKFSWLVLALLLLATFQIVNFSVIRGTISAGFRTDLSFSIGFDLTPFLLLIAYSIIRKDLVKGIISTVFKGSKEEMIEKEDKMVNFYYGRFSTCDENEFNSIWNNFNDYPVEAQKALKKMKAERDELNVTVK